jgi:hypothetical protein
MRINAFFHRECQRFFREAVKDTQIRTAFHIVKTTPVVSPLSLCPPGQGFPSMARSNAAMTLINAANPVCELGFIPNSLSAVLFEGLKSKHLKPL